MLHVATAIECLGNLYIIIHYYYYVCIIQYCVWSIVHAHSTVHVCSSVQAFHVSVVIYMIV